MRFLLLVITLCLLASCGNHELPADQSDSLDGYTVIAGSIAMSQTTHEWIVYEDGLHKVMNMTDIAWSESPGSEGVRVYWGFNASEIVTCDISVDETYALIGLVAGAKIDVDSVIIQFNKAFTEMDDVNGNVFVYCIVKR